MALYKILIVDDEDEIRLGVIKKIQWEKYGFQVVGDAQNGVEALEKSISLQPDIIMTDIRMPFMDGLELGEEIQKIMPTAKIIIFSGCDDFEYAQKAISINVFEYVLKPINSMNLIEILIRLKEKLDSEYEEKRNIELLEKYYEESLPILRDQFLIASIEGKLIDVDMNQQLNKFNMNFQSKYFITGVIRLDFYKGENTILNNNKMLLPISAQNIFDEIMDNICNVRSFLYLDNVIFIANIKINNEVKLLINGLNDYCRAFKKYINGDIVVGLGRVYDSYEKVSLSYKEARTALDYKAILKEEDVIFIDDVEPDGNNGLDFNEALEKRFTEAIKIGEEDDINLVVNELFDIGDKGILSINEYRLYGIELLTSLIKTIKIYNLNIKQIIGNDFNEYLYLSKLTNINDMKNWFIEIAIKANKNIKGERINSSKLLIDKVKTYINENFSDSELSVDKMCLEFHLSSAYFSTIFKKETGISFVNYLTDVRLEEAIKLLNTTDYKTSIIGQKVGYMEPNYFSYVFKRKYGISPTKYRKR